MSFVLLSHTGNHCLNVSRAVIFVLFEKKFLESLVVCNLDQREQNTAACALWMWFNSWEMLKFCHRGYN